MKPTVLLHQQQYPINNQQSTSTYSHSVLDPNLEYCTFEVRSVIVRGRATPTASNLACTTSSWTITRESEAYTSSIGT